MPPANPAAESARELPPIRAFDIETLARLGRDIYRHDQWAWVATDLLDEKIGLQKFGSEGGCGWVVDESGAMPLVRFLRREGEEIEAACDVQFPKDKSPILEVPHERQITPAQSLRYKALESTRKHMVGSRFPLCEVRGSYNTVVLDDPSGKGFLVYWLRPKETQEDVPVGGHYRISVSADGATVAQVDRLSASCLTLQRPKNKPGTAQPEYLFVTHLVSNTPVETHVFLSLQEKLPLYVGTPDRRIWVTDQGKIIYLDKLQESSEKRESAQKEKP